MVHNRGCSRGDEFRLGRAMRLSILNSRSRPCRKSCLTGPIPMTRYNTKSGRTRSLARPMAMTRSNTKPDVPPHAGAGAGSGVGVGPSCKNTFPPVKNTDPPKNTDTAPLKITAPPKNAHLKNTNTVLPIPKNTAPPKPPKNTGLLTFHDYSSDDYRTMLKASVALSKAALDRDESCRKNVNDLHSNLQHLLAERTKTNIDILTAEQRMKAQLAEAWNNMVGLGSRYTDTDLITSDDYIKMMKDSEALLKAALNRIESDRKNVTNVSFYIQHLDEEIKKTENNIVTAEQRIKGNLAEAWNKVLGLGSKC